jgi:GMP synthase (glutamine-hydrolysing)
MFTVLCLLYIQVFCELYSCLVTASALESNHVVGIILSGGPASVYEDNSPHVHPTVWEFIARKHIPVLGICYGMQEMAHVQGGSVCKSPEREFGRATLCISTESCAHTQLAQSLFRGVDMTSQMWMSHGDKVNMLPNGFVSIATTANSEFAAIANADSQMYGIQFHPEVSHSIQVSYVCFVCLRVCLCVSVCMSVCM